MAKKAKKMSATPIPPKGARKQGTGTGQNPLGYSTTSGAKKGKK
jgi:hypothetical protein